MPPPTIPLTRNAEDIIAWALTDPIHTAHLIWNKEKAVYDATIAGALTHAPWGSDPNDGPSLDEFLKCDFICQNGKPLHWSGSDYSGAEVIYIIANTVGNQMAAARSGAPPSVPPPWTT